MSYAKEIGSYLAGLVMEMVVENENGDFTKLDGYRRANQQWKAKIAKSYHDTFDKHEHEGIAAAHKHAWDAVHSAIERMGKSQKASAGRRERDSAMRDMGMTKVRGSQSGKTYWESAELTKEDLALLDEYLSDEDYKKAQQAHEVAVAQSGRPENHPSYRAGMNSYNNTFRKTAKTKGQQERMNNHHFSTAKQKHIAGIGNLPDKVVAAKHFTSGYEAAHAQHRKDSGN